MVMHGVDGETKLNLSPHFSDCFPVSVTLEALTKQFIGPRDLGTATAEGDGSTCK